MLVLTRRENEKILFPALDATVEVLEVKQGRVRLGITAPAELQILREEVYKAAGGQLSDATTGLAAFQSARLKKTRHTIRNHLNSATVGLALARRQLHAGLIENLEQTLSRIGEGFGSLGVEVEGLVDRAEPPKQDRQPLALLVEDDSNECELLAGFLRLAGYKVDTARDGEDAMDHLRNDCIPDVMLLDMNMPRCDGPTTVKMIRGEPSFANLKIFAVTGYSPDHFGLDVKRSGIDHWFQKPLNPEKLLGELNASRRALVSA